MNTFKVPSDPLKCVVRVVAVAVVIGSVCVPCNAQSGLLDLLPDKTVSPEDKSFSIKVPRSWSVKDYSGESGWTTGVRCFDPEGTLVIFLNRKPVPDQLRGLTPLRTLDLLTGIVVEGIKKDGGLLLKKPERSIKPLVKDWSTVAIHYRVEAENKTILKEVTAIGDWGFQMTFVFDGNKTGSEREWDRNVEMAERIKQSLLVDLSRWES